MKKIVYTFAFVVLMTMVASCGSKDNGSKDASEAAVETVGVEETVIEAVQDTAEVADRASTEGQGFGRCSQCACKSFEGRGDVCKNCGHSYKKHY